jgi:hypothetical protein
MWWSSSSTPKQHNKNNWLILPGWHVTTMTRKDTRAQNNTFFDDDDSGLLNSMDIPQPIRDFMSGLQIRLQEMKLMACAGVYAWSVMLIRNYGHLLAF